MTTGCKHRQRSGIGFAVANSGSQLSGATPAAPGLKLRLTEDPALVGLVVCEHGEKVCYVSYAAARLVIAS